MRGQAVCVAVQSCVRPAHHAAARPAPVSAAPLDEQQQGKLTAELHNVRECGEMLEAMHALLVGAGEDAAGHG